MTTHPTNLPPLDPALDELMRAAVQYETARKERDRLILKARAAGVPLRKVAMYAHVAPQTVANIVARETGDR